MGFLIAIFGILFLLWAKNHASGSLSVSGSATGTASDAGMPSAFGVDASAPSAGGPIGNTHLSSMNTVQTADGQLLQMAYRPSGLQNGGGIVAGSGHASDANPSGSTGSGISAIERMNAPMAAHRAAPAGGASRVATPDYVHVLRPAARTVAAGHPAVGHPAAPPQATPAPATRLVAARPIAAVVQTTAARPAAARNVSIFNRETVGADNRARLASRTLLK